MYQIIVEDYGLRCRIYRTLTKGEAAAIVDELEVASCTFAGSFSVLLDRHELTALGDGATAYIIGEFLRIRALNLDRVAVAPPADEDRFRRIATKIARLSGLTQHLRYFDVRHRDWEEKARAWLLEEEQPRRRSRRWSFGQMLAAA